MRSARLELVFYGSIFSSIIVYLKANNLSGFVDIICYADSYEFCNF